MRGRIATLGMMALAMAAAPVLAETKSDPLAGRVAGPPAQCIDTSTAMAGPTIVGQGMILVNSGGRRVWLAKVRGQCPAIRPFNTLIVDRWGSRLCRNDRFRVIEQGMSIPSGWCFFDGFVPYDRTK